MCYINIFENKIYIIFYFKDVDTHYEFKISCLIYYLILINIILILYFNKFRIVKNKSETNVIERFAYFCYNFSIFIFHESVEHYQYYYHGVVMLI